jgi:excisionase family DNA binding protein
MPEERDSVMTIEELPTDLDIPKSTLYKLAQERKVSGQNVGRHWRFHKHGIDRQLMQHRDRA